MKQENVSAALWPSAGVLKLTMEHSILACTCTCVHAPSYAIAPDCVVLSVKILHIYGWIGGLLLSAS